jgi:hypothetical protein
VEAQVARLGWLTLLAVASCGAVYFAWQPVSTWTLKIGHHSFQESRTLAATVALLSNALSGWFGRLWLLGAIESYRMIEGLQPPAKQEPEKPATAPALMTPEEVFATWAATHLRLQHDSTVASKDCRNSYRSYCAQRAYPTFGDGTFFRTLADEAAKHPGQVFSMQSNYMHYKGWKLIEADQSEGEIAPIPERPAA